MTRTVCKDLETSQKGWITPIHHGTVPRYVPRNRYLQVRCTVALFTIIVIRTKTTTLWIYIVLTREELDVNARPKENYSAASMADVSIAAVANWAKLGCVETRTGEQGADKITTSHKVKSFCSVHMSAVYPMVSRSSCTVLSSAVYVQPLLRS